MIKACFIITLTLLFACKQRFFTAGSGSMEGTIFPGDRFMVTRSDSFKKDDIVVFDYYGPDYSVGNREDGSYPMSWAKMVFRLIACSGDSLEIKNGEVFINGEIVPLPPRAKMPYEVLSTEVIKEFSEMEIADISTFRNDDTMGYRVNLTTEQAFSYRETKPAIVRIKRISNEYRSAEDSFFARASRNGKWSLDQYGPVRIPRPGETILVDPVNFTFYKNIPGITLGRHKVKENLYFVMGDNRHGSMDSRYIGLISHSKMYGVVK